MVDFVPDRGQWVVFKATVPAAALDFLRAHQLPAPHKTADGHWVGIWDPGAPPGRTLAVNGAAEASRPARVVMVDALGHDVMAPAVTRGRVELAPLGFALDEAAALAPANDDDLPPGRNAASGRANPIRRPRHERAKK